MKTKIYLSILVAAVSFGAVSCVKDYTDRNTNPEQATDEMLEHDNLRVGSYISQMIANVLPSYQRGEQEYGSASYQVVQGLTGNIFANYEAASNSGFHQTNEYNLVADGWTKALFEDAYVRAASPWTQLSALRATAPEAAALGDVLKVAVLHRVADAYGPLPYSQLGTGSIHVAYDTQEEAYRSMFQDLDSAIAVLEGLMAKESTMLKQYDNVFYGDVRKWIQFANTLRLRLALRVAYADEALYAAEADKAMKCAEGFLEEDAMLHPGAAAWEYPIYVIEYNFNDGDAKAGATIVTYMNSYADPRRAKYFTAGSDGNYYGVRMGAKVDDEYPKSTLWSKVNCTNSDPLMWMSGAESFFLRAEHALRGGNDGLAKSFYEQGVRKSFELWKVAGADEYLAVTDPVGGYTDPVNNANSAGAGLTSVSVAWNSQSGFEGHLEQIITQKYIAGFPEGMEAWAEFRRTGYPKVIPTATNNSGGLIDTQAQIRRLIYPTSEYTANGANVQAGVTLLTSEAADAASEKGDNGGTRVWWDKKQ
jgi:hypothetical protein